MSAENNRQEEKNKKTKNTKKKRWTDEVKITATNDLKEKLNWIQTADHPNIQKQIISYGFKINKFVCLLLKYS